MSGRTRLLALCGVLAVAVGVAVLAGPALLQRASAAVLLVAVAAGLAVTVRGAGVPSLAHGAFVGLGVYAAAIARHRYGADPVVAILVAGVVGLVAGRLLAAAVAPLRPAFAALVTWLIAWAFSGAVADLPGLTGGSRGIVLGPARTSVPVLGVDHVLGPVAWWWASVAVVAVSLGLLAALRARYGAALALVRADPSAALAQGVPVAHLRAVAFATPALLATLAGAVLVHVEGVADPGRAGVLLSAQLFVVVLFGGTAGPLGPLVGWSVLAGVGWLASTALGAVSPGPSGLERVAPAVAATVVVALLALAPDGVVNRLRTRRSAPQDRPRPAPTSTGATPAPEQRSGADLVARGLVVELGGRRVLDAVDLTVPAGSCVGILGPNGSGKTVLLRVLSGALTPDAGTVTLGGAALVPTPRADPARRRHAGVARAPQRLVDAPDVTPRQLVLAALESTRPRWSLAALLATPRARSEARASAGEAAALLTDAGLGPAADTPLGALDVTTRRLAQLAAAGAGRPPVVLLDEPAAGLELAGVTAVAARIEALLAAGTAVVVVEHDRRVLAAVAARVVGLLEGGVVAVGSLDEVLADPAVRAGWLGEGAPPARALPTAGTAGGDR